jgi:hypothetical protein
MTWANGKGIDHEQEHEHDYENKLDYLHWAMRIGVSGVRLPMSDPRNVAHDKKVTQEKQHKHTDAAPAAKAPSPGEKAEAPGVEQGPSEHEKSVAVLSKLKEMEFHSRGNIETLAQLTLTIEDELKQGEFSEPIGALYSAQDAFHAKIETLIEAYGAKCEQLKGPP